MEKEIEIGRLVRRSNGEVRLVYDKNFKNRHMEEKLITLMEAKYEIGRLEQRTEERIHGIVDDRQKRFGLAMYKKGKERAENARN